MQGQYEPVSVALSLYAHCSAEDVLAVWARVVADVSDLTMLMEGHPAYAQFQAFLVRLFSEIVAKGQCA